MKSSRGRHTPAAAALLALLIVGLAGPALADEIDAKQFSTVRQKMQAFVDGGDIAGAVTVVGNKDGVVSLEAVGRQDLDKGIAMPTDALFRIASMTKPVTAIGIMILADDGKLSIDDPVEKHLPEFRGQLLVAERGKETVNLKKPSRPITIKDLLTHTSGMPQPPEGLRDLYVKRTHTLAEGVMAFSQRPLDFEPGTKWAYCNTGIDTLGRIIEVVSGHPYERFLHARIFQPLGMNDTTFFPTDQQLQRLALNYDKKEGKLVLPANTLIGPPRDARYPIPAGGLYSTGADLAKLYQMMLNGGLAKDSRIISVDSIKAMTQVHTGDLKTGFSPGMGWGLGWGVVVTPTSVTDMLSPGAYGHGGAFGTQAWIDPRRNIFMVMLIQRVGMPNVDETKIRQEFQAAVMTGLKK